MTGGDKRSYVLGNGDDDYVDANTIYDVRVTVWSSEGSSDSPDGDTVEVFGSTPPDLPARPTVTTDGATALDVSSDRCADTCGVPGYTHYRLPGAVEDELRFLQRYELD